MASKVATGLAQDIMNDRHGADYYGFDPNLLADLIDSRFTRLRDRIGELGGEVPEEFDPSKEAKSLPKHSV